MSRILFLAFLIVLAFATVKEFIVDEIENFLFSAGKKLITPETYKLGICILATTAKMKVDRDILAKFFTEKAKEDRGVKVRALAIKHCMDQLTSITKVPVSRGPHFCRKTSRTR